MSKFATNQTKKKRNYAKGISFEDIESFLEKNNPVKIAVREVFANLRRNYQQFGKVTDEDLKALNSLFGETLEKALPLVNKKKITFYHTKDGNGLYQAVVKMNDRENWKNRNPYADQFVYPSPSYNSDGWVHVPPQIMPWGVPSVSQPSIVRFTAGDLNTVPTPSKRKGQPSSDTLPSKILVTEEKMAAHMQSLHISDVDVKPKGTPTSEVICKEEPMETECLPKLVISDEIKNMKTATIIPETILKRIERPEMAVVVWRAPPTAFEDKIKLLRKASQSLGRAVKEKMKEMEKLTEDQRERDVAMEADTELETEPEMENNNVETVFRPINPVPTQHEPMRSQYFHPPPQMGYPWLPTTF